MPSTYTPDPTATQAPASAPDPDDYPLESLPVSGDGATAASVAQPFKVLGDFIAWMKRPFAKASSWTQPIGRYQNARRQDRQYIDHMGFPMIQGILWDQNWDSRAPGLNWPSIGVEAGNPWVALPGTGTVITTLPTLFPTLKITPPTGAATSSTIQRVGTCVLIDDLGFTMKWTAALATVGANRTTMVMGVTDGLIAPPTWGAWFSKANGDTNWIANVSGAAPVNCGVPPVANTFSDFRIDILGINVSDDTVGRVVFYIDGNVVANIPRTISAIPTTADPLTPVFGATTTTTGGAAVPLFIGPVKGRHNTFLNAL